jgi:hypothetical protein
MWNTGLIVLLGVWMMIAPLLVPDPSAHAWNDRVIGALVAGLALAERHAYRWEVFAAAAIGVWLFLSSFVPAMRVDPYVIWNDAGSGVLLIITGARATMKTPERVAPKLAP